MGVDRERAGRGLTLGSTVLGLMFAIGFGLLILVGGSLPSANVGRLSFPLLWAMPALLALLHFGIAQSCFCPLPS